ncbi:methyl-accepting chemotaxis protein [uncultured Salinisphaera sp.]|uniref:methyl-accepting chemotaxis protein n=1 Tax=uncultured Salinisphaera sp. TaxID=359372 RepID=UPI0032B30BEB
MKHFTSIKHFVVLAAGACILSVVAALLIYNYVATKRTGEFVEQRTGALLEGAIDERLAALANAQGEQINRKLEQALGIARDLAAASELAAEPGANSAAFEFGRPELSALVQQAVAKNDFLLDAFIGWEPNAFGNDDAYVVPANNTQSYDGSGRFRPWAFKNDQGVAEVSALDITGMENPKMLESGIRRGEYYLCPKEGGDTCVVDPAFYDYDDKRVMVATFSVPIVVDGAFKGVAGTDVSVDFIQTLLSQSNQGLYEGAGRMALVAPLGRLVAYTGDAARLGQPATSVLSAEGLEKLTQARQSGEAVSARSTNGEMIESYRPIRVGNTDTVWTLVMQLPVAAVMADLDVLQGDLADQRTADTLGMVLVSGLVALLGLVLIWMVGRSIARPLSQLGDRMREIASGDGDLTQRLPVAGRNELATVATQFNAFVDKIDHVMIDVRDSSENVKMASGEISTGSVDLSRRTENTAASLEQSAAAMEELTSTVANSAESSRHAARLSSEAAQAADEGSQSMAAVVDTMRDISGSAREIEKIIAVIDSIAFQTNLLALNASVEAARAGEQGRGFAVVAQEVRNLANRSTQAAGEIKTLIDTSVEKTANGEALVERTGERIKSIVEQVNRVNGLITEITTAAQEQNTAILEVNQAVSQLDEMTQQNAALVEESAAASDSLSQEATRLARIIGAFKLSSHNAQPASQFQARSERRPSEQWADAPHEPAAPAYGV